MRKNLNVQVCNRCGKNVFVKNGFPMEEMAQFEINWGYFSDKAGETHRFVLCEECYNQIINEFKIKPEVTERNELL